MRPAWCVLSDGARRGLNGLILARSSVGGVVGGSVAFRGYFRPCGRVARVCVLLFALLLRFWRVLSAIFRAFSLLLYSR